MKRHAFDPFSLVAGLLFGFFALFFLTGDRSIRDLTWPWAAVIPLMALGLLAVLVGLRRAFVHEGSDELTETAAPEEAEPVELEP